MPEGAIPVSSLDYTKSFFIFILKLKNFLLFLKKKIKSYSMNLKAYTTNNIQYYFYYPSEGQFTIYPSNVSRNGVVVAKASE